MTFDLFSTCHGRGYKNVVSLGLISSLSAGLLLFGSSDSHAAAVQNTFLFGVNQHVARAGAQYDPTATYRLENVIGVNSYRETYSFSLYPQWASLVGKMPDYTFYRPLKAFMALSRTTPLIVLGGTDGVGGQPLTPQQIATYAAYAGSAATTFNSPVLFEIWNEWNLGTWNGGKGTGTPQQYVAVAQAAYKSIKMANPTATVLVGAAGGDQAGSDWIIQAAKAGLLLAGDGISLHMYNHCAAPYKRTAASAIATIQALATSLYTYGNKYPNIYVSEVGWPTQDQVCGGVPAAIQKDNMAQFVLWSTAIPYIKGVWLYELTDDSFTSLSPTDRENNFGIFTSSLSDKGGGCELGSSWNFIRTFSFQGQSDSMTSSGNVHELIYNNGASYRVALFQTAYSPLNPAHVQISGNSTTFPVCGQLPTQTGGIVSVSGTPVLIQTDAAGLAGMKIY